MFENTGNIFYIHRLLKYAALAYLPDLGYVF